MSGAAKAAEARAERERREREKKEFKEFIKKEIRWNVDEQNFVEALTLLIFATVKYSFA